MNGAFDDGESRRDDLVCLIYEEYHEVLLFYTIGICKKFRFDPILAFDLLQDFYMKVLHQSDTVQKGMEKKGVSYLMQILKHLCIDQDRKRKSRHRISDVLEYEGPRISNIYHLCVEICTEGFYEDMQQWLSEENFEIMRLYISGYSYKELAEKFQKPTKTIASRIHRAKKVLAQRLGRL